MTKSKMIRIESDQNADWIKTGEGHKLEAQIHKELARRYAEQQVSEEDQKPKK